jgi:hypothetical protein
MQAESDVKRCSSKATTTSRGHGAFTFAVSDLTAGGSGMASIEAATINPLSIKTRYEMDFIYYAHDSGFFS